jgi:WD40 repeat protein
MNQHGDFEFSQINTKNFGGHIDEVNCAALSVDYEIMVTGSDDQQLRIFNTVSGELVTTLDGHDGAIKVVTISPNSYYIASASYDKTVRVWVMRDAECIYVLTGHSKSVECLAFSHDSSLLCSGSWDKTIILWNVEDGSRQVTMHGHQDLVQSAAFSSDGQFLATGSWDYTVRVWFIAATGDGVDQRQQLTLLNRTEVNRQPMTPRHGDLLHSMNGHRGNIHTVAFSNDGKLASGSWDKTVRLWNPLTGCCLHVLKGHGGWVQALAFDADGQHLVSGGDHDAVIIWSCASGECIQTLDLAETESVLQCAFGPKGIIVASASGTLRTASCKTDEDNESCTDGCTSVISS